MAKRRSTGILVQKLDESVCLFDGDLGKAAMLVEDTKQITFSNFLGWQVSYSHGHNGKQ